MSTLEEFLVGAPELEDDWTHMESPANAEQADWHVRRLSRLRRLMAENQAIAHAEIHRIRVWLDEENRKLEQKASWIEEALAGYHQALLEQDPQRRTVSLPAGTLRARKHPDSVVVLDVDLFAHWAAAAGRLEFIRTKTEVVKSEVKRLLTPGPRADDVDPGHVLLDGGEVVPGVVHVPGETSFTVDTPNQKEVAL